MALQKQQLIEDIKQLLVNTKDKINEQESIDNYAQSLGQIIYDFVRSGEVQVTGTSQTGGAVTATGEIQ